MLVSHFKKLVYYVVGRCGSVDEEQIVVGNFVLKEVLFVIFLLVQSYNSLDAKLLKYLNVFFRVMTVPLVSITLLNGAHESHKLAGNDPIDITIFNALIELVFLDVERAEVVPLELDGVFETLQALK